jgi:hypothetical protein
MYKHIVLWKRELGQGRGVIGKEREKRGEKKRPTSDAVYI